MNYPRLAILLCAAGLECGGTGRSHGMILLAGTTADTNRSYHLAVPIERDAAGKNHDFAGV